MIVDELNIQYEQRLLVLEKENDELRDEINHYANNELVRLENILQTQQEESMKSLKEKEYYVERCELLEKQNKELKTRIDNNKIGKPLLHNFW